MASGKVARGKLWSITTQSVSLSVILGTMQSALHQENVLKVEPGVAKISFAKVKIFMTIRLGLTEIIHIALKC